MDDEKLFSRKELSDELLFSREAADFLGITPQRLNQIVQSKKLIPIKKSASGMIFMKSDLAKRSLELAEIAPSLGITSDKDKIDIYDKTSIQAINFFSLLSIYSISEKKFDTIFSELETVFDFSLPINTFSNKLSAHISKSEELLLNSFTSVETSFKQLKSSDIIIKRGSELYPHLLFKTSEAPKFLFARGDISLLKRKIISVVGTRKPSELGEKRAKILAGILCDLGIVVASGLATGIDYAAHSGSLGAKGKTIAVIGTPLNRVYPSENRKLQEDISERGLVISQFAPSQQVHRWNFPLRNSVMSGISLATVVIEAGETSGALIQANYALKQNRLVFIPQSAVENPKISWPKKYLQKKGAYSFSRVEDLLEKLETLEVLSKDQELIQLSFDQIKAG